MTIDAPLSISQHIVQAGLWLAAAIAIFGGTLPATRLAVSAFDPFALTALRTAISGLCALTLLLVLRRPLPDAILRGDVKDGEPVVVTREGDKLVFQQKTPMADSGVAP